MVSRLLTQPRSLDGTFFPDPSRMPAVRPYLRRRPARRLVRVRQPAARALRPGCRQVRDHAGRAGCPASHAVALPRTPPGTGEGEHCQLRRRHDAAAAHAPARGQAGRPRTVDEGRRSAAHRDVQGPRRGCRRLASGRTRYPVSGHAHQRERRRRVVGLLRPGGPAQPDRHAHRRASGQPGRVRGSRRGTAPCRWPDQRRWPPGQPGCGGRRDPVRRVDPEGALPHRGQEDDRAGDRRTAQLVTAGCHHVPDRRRGGAHRHLQGPGGTAGTGLDRRRHAPAGGRAGRRLRTNRRGF
jgi:hypothetical protein